MIKKTRRDVILELISNNDISTQEELTEQLQNNGFNVSQATVSRDIKELNLVKVEGLNKKYRYSKIDITNQNISPQIINLFKQIVVSIESANNIIVVKTLSGNASAAGMAIDQIHFSQVLGTVAGDDTILLVIKEGYNHKEVHQQLSAIVPEMSA